MMTAKASMGGLVAHSCLIFFWIIILLLFFLYSFSYSFSSSSSGSGGVGGGAGGGMLPTPNHTLSMGLMTVSVFRTRIQ